MKDFKLEKIYFMRTYCFKTHQGTMQSILSLDEHAYATDQQGGRDIKRPFTKRLGGLLLFADGWIQWIRSSLGRISCASRQQCYSVLWNRREGSAEVGEDTTARQ